MGDTSIKPNEAPAAPRDFPWCPWVSRSVAVREGSSIVIVIVAAVSGG